MCYSILVETALHKLAQEFAAHIDYESFAEVYTSRSQRRSLIKIPSALDRNFADKQQPENTVIRRAIAEYQTSERALLEKKISAKQALIQTLSTELITKPGKVRQEKLATASRMLAKLTSDHARLGAFDKEPRNSASRIFMYSYAPGVITADDGSHQIVPLRYQLRPAGSRQEIPSHINCFNARVDKLEDRYNWQRLFMRRHAALQVKSFYEWVAKPGEPSKSVQVEFIPRDEKPLWVPALWDEWIAPDQSYRIRSFAILTRDPPEEIRAVGHDRCPVFPQQEFLYEWLHPEKHTKDYYYQLFQRLQGVYFNHRFAN
jgi:putative SOS response-associated peptidase YedK